jgi:hypothetical protein
MGCILVGNAALNSMAINTTFNASPNSRGSQGVLFQFGAVPTIGNVIDGSIYYPGSTIQIQEIVDIQTSIYDATLVDIDFNWFEPRKYLGSYQVQSDYGLNRDVADDGFLTSEYQRITRYSYYTITSDGQGAVTLPNKNYINDCNFDLRDDIISNPPAVNILRQVLDNKGDDHPIFTVDNTLAPVSLANDRFYPRMLGVGLFLKPGVELDFVKYRARAINGVRVALPSVAAKVCDTKQSSCEQLYAAYVAANPGLVFETFGECEAYRLNPPPNSPPTDTAGTCILDAWICPTDESFSVPAYTIQYGN